MCARGNFSLTKLFRKVERKTMMFNVIGVNRMIREDELIDKNFLKKSLN
jgi:hypothetical protein